jgi:hypothetical protein
MGNKRAYFQGGGGVNEPTPGEKKYKSDPAIVVQPRFEEVFYRNYDLYEVPGFEHIGPGAGWHALQNYNSVGEFLEARRKRLAPRYVADDSWQLDSGKRTKENPGIKARAALLNRIIKTASNCGFCGKSKIDVTFPCEHCGKGGAVVAGDENNGPNFDYGKGLYSNMNKYKSVQDFEEHADKGPGAFFADDNEDHMMPPKEHGTKIYDWKNSIYQGTPKATKRHDSNNIDFLADQYIDPNIVTPEPGDVDGGNPVGEANQMGGYLDEYLPEKDFEGKDPDTLDFGRDYSGSDQFPSKKDFAPATIDQESVKKLIDKYSPAPTSGLYGLPDGVDLPEEDLGNPTDINPDYGSVGPESKMYEDKWNI